MNIATLFGIFAVLIASIFLRQFGMTSLKVSLPLVAKATKEAVKTTLPFPVVFFSHGGPTFMYQDDPFGDKGAWKTVKKFGTQIKSKWKPDYIIVVSAHWQSGGSNLIEVAVPDIQKQLLAFRKPQKLVDPAVENSLIYDFYGFPDHMYQEQFHTKGSPSIAAQIKQHLEENEFRSNVVPRGIDHGVWVPFKVAFSDYNTQTGNQPETPLWDLPDTPVVQVSLTLRDTDFASHYKLGQVLDHFRKNEIWDEAQQRYLKGMVVCSGMSVHNLRDMAYCSMNKLAPYTAPFSKKLTEIVTTGATLDQYEDLKTNHAGLLRGAHPTAEHFLPIVVASGMASVDKEKGKELYNANFGSLAWGIFQFGEVKL